MSSLLLLITILLLCGNFRSTKILFALSLTLWLALSDYFRLIGPNSKIVLATLIGIFVLFLFIEPVRERLFSGPIRLWVKKTLPPISQTEQEAIDAGESWHEASIVQGALNMSTVLEDGFYQLTAQEQEYLNGPVQEFCDSLCDWEIVQKHWNLTEASWELIRKHRLFGLMIPKSYGGLEFSATAHSSIVAKIATKSPSAATIVMVPNSLGPAELLLHYGTQEQKDLYLPKLARSEEIPCFALTSTEAGSDASSMPDYGVVCYQDFEGEQTLGISLTWEKRYITLAPIATLIGLAFKLYDPQKILGAKTDYGITLCLIPADHPGVEIGRRHNPLGMAFPNGPTRGRNVFIPMSFIIGGQERIGQGWKMLMECLSVGRGISLPALATAIGHLSTFSAVAYSKVRHQFKVPIAQFEGIKLPLGHLAGLTYLLESTRLFTASAIDNGVKPAIASAIAKYHMTEISREVINKAMDIYGGKAIILGPRNVLASPYISTPISITVEGANILTRSLMIFGQGVMRCHPFLLGHIKEAQEGGTLAAFDRGLVSHIAYSLSHLARAVVDGLTFGLLIPVSSKVKEKSFLQKFQLLSRALAVATDLSLLILGGQLKRKEALSGRLGDMISYLYLATASLAYYQGQTAGLKESAQEKYVRWSLSYCLYHCQEAFYDFCDNFPIRLLGVFLKKLVLPWGRVCSLPQDKLTLSLADTLLSNDPLLSRLTHLNATSLENEPNFHLLKAFEMSFTLEEPLKRMAKFKRKREDLFDKNAEQIIDLAENAGLIKKEEARLLKIFEAYRVEVIKTDDFDFHTFSSEKMPVEKEIINEENY